MRGYRIQVGGLRAEAGRPVRAGAELCKAAGAEQLGRSSPSALRPLFSHNPVKVKQLQVLWHHLQLQKHISSLFLQ